MLKPDEEFVAAEWGYLTDGQQREPRWQRLFALARRGAEAEAEITRMRSRYEPHDEPDARQYCEHLDGQIKELLSEITRLRANLRARLADHINGTPCAEIRWQQERETLTAEIERLRAALQPLLSKDARKLLTEYAEAARGMDRNKMATALELVLESDAKRRAALEGRDD